MYMTRGRCPRKDCDNEAPRINGRQTLCKDCKEIEAETKQREWIRAHLEEAPGQEWVAFYACDVCGGLVADRAQHYAFHQRLGRTASEAGQALSHHIRY